MVSHSWPAEVYTRARHVVIGASGGAGGGIGGDGSAGGVGSGDGAAGGAGGGDSMWNNRIERTRSQPGVGRDSHPPPHTNGLLRYV